MSELDWTIDWSKVKDARTEAKPTDMAKTIEEMIASVDDRRPFRPFISEGQERDLRKIAEGEGLEAEKARKILATPGLAVTRRMPTD